MPRSRSHAASAIVARMMLMLLPCVGCASIQTGGSVAKVTDASSDGLNVATTVDAAAARQAAVHAFEANGFTVDRRASSRSSIISRPRTLTTDTSIVVSALVTPVDLATTKAMVTVSGTFSVAHTRIHNRQLVWRAGTAGGPWQALGAVRDSVRAAVEHAP
jgi:hypothetical protein